MHATVWSMLINVIICRLVLLRNDISGYWHKKSIVKLQFWVFVWKTIRSKCHHLVKKKLSIFRSGVGLHQPCDAPEFGVQSLSIAFSLVSALWGLVDLLGPPHGRPPGGPQPPAHPRHLHVLGVLVFSVIMAIITLGVDVRYNQRLQRYL